MREFELKNKNGFRVGLLDHGASIRSVLIPGVDGPLNAVLAYPDPTDYQSDVYFMGSTLGRYAGRIEHGQFTLNQRHYQLAMGDEMHCLHGGPDGFSSRAWTAEASPDSESLIFRYQSNDGEQGFPGRLSVSVRYSLQRDFGLLIEYQASTDADTVINLSNHAYFNLNSTANEIGNHHFTINADRYAVLDDHAIPTGELRDVEGSRFDLRRENSLSELMNSGNSAGTQGFDHAFELNRSGPGREFAASAWSPETGLRLRLFTTQAALQFYTGEYLGKPMQKRGGFCFEAQNFPDAPNKRGFPSAVLKPGQVYEQSILYEFSYDDKP